MQRNSRNRAGRASPKKSQGGRQRRRRTQGQNLVVLGHDMPLGNPRAGPFPNSMIVYFRLILTGTLTNTASFAGMSFRTNDVYSWDGSNLSQCPDYHTMTISHSNFRSLGYFGKTLLVNKQSFPITATLLQTNITPTGTPGDDWLSRAGQKWGKTITLSGSSAMNRGTLSDRHSITEIVGSTSPLFDDSFRAIANASPTDLTWWNIGIDSAGQGNVTDGVYYEVDIIYKVQAYGYRPDQPLTLPPERVRSGIKKTPFGVQTWTRT